MLKQPTVDLSEQSKFRLDKWLWAARFFKTRSLATKAVEGGKVQLNRSRAKPAKSVNIGDELTIRMGNYLFEINVLALSDKRGSALQAQKLYQETDAGKQKRAELAAQLRVQPEQNTLKGRPTKRDRREIDRFNVGAW